jgi:rhamnose transport system permease protein
MLAQALPHIDRPAGLRAWVSHEKVLAALLAAEVILFGAIGTNFLSLTNGFEIVRLSAEVGLLALAMTPVIVTGGIDLSVGSLMGLSAVLFGKMWRDGHLPIGAAAVLTVVLGALAGGLNALLITRLRIPALIVTLGTYSLFRGLAEGVTRGVDNFTKFPESFQFLGQGELAGGVPPQLFLLVVATIGFWLLLHRTTIGRGLYAIGFSPEGARYAGIPVDRRLALAYVLSGAVAGLAAILYVSHNSQAKADAGLEYELKAITAVVLGGTSLFGGRGSVLGTFIGVLIVGVFRNGLTLIGVEVIYQYLVTGVLVILAVSIDQLTHRRRL